MNSGALAILDIVRYIMVDQDVTHCIGGELEFYDMENHTHFDIAQSPNSKTTHAGNLASIYDAIAVTCTTTAYCMLGLMTITQKHRGWSRHTNNSIDDGHYPVPENNQSKHTSKVASEFMSDLAEILFDFTKEKEIYKEGGKYLGTFCIQTSSY